MANSPNIQKQTGSYQRLPADLHARLPRYGEWLAHKRDGSELLREDGLLLKAPEKPIPVGTRVKYWNYFEELVEGVIIDNYGWHYDIRYQGELDFKIECAVPEQDIIAVVSIGEEAEN